MWKLWFQICLAEFSDRDLGDYLRFGSRREKIKETHKNKRKDDERVKNGG